MTLETVDDGWIRLRQAAEAARLRPFDEVLDAIDSWARQWENSDGACWRVVEELAPADPLIGEAIRRLARSARRGPVRHLIAEQLGHPDALAMPTPRLAGGHRTARGVGGIAVFLGGAAGLASWPLFLLGILSRSAVFARMTSADRRWPLLFKRTLADIDEGLADCIHADHWPSTDSAAHHRLASGADLVLAFGADVTMERVRSCVPPTTPFIPFGSRLSIGVVGSRLSLEEAASLAAVDMSIYDQGGCLSPQAFLVEGTAERGRDFSAALGVELDRLALDSPPPIRTGSHAAAIRTAREVAAFEEGALILGPDNLSWTVLFSSRESFDPSPLGRTVHVRPYRTLDDAQRLLHPYRGVIEAAGVGVTSDQELIAAAEWLGPLGVNRVCPLGSLQFPPLHWSHDGRRMLASFVRFTDVESLGLP